MSRYGLEIISAKATSHYDARRRIAAGVIPPRILRGPSLRSQTTNSVRTDPSSYRLSAGRMSIVISIV